MVRAYENYVADLPGAARSWIGASIMIGAMLSLIVTLILRGTVAPAGSTKQSSALRIFGWSGMVIAASFGVLLACIGVIHSIAEFNARGFRPKSVFGDAVVPLGCAVASIWSIVSTVLELALTRWERDHVSH